MHSREPHPPGIALSSCRNLGELRNTLQLLPVFPPSRSRTHFGACTLWCQVSAMEDVHPKGRKGQGARGNRSEICRPSRKSNQSRAQCAQRTEEICGNLRMFEDSHRTRQLAIICHICHICHTCHTLVLYQLEHTNFRNGTMILSKMQPFVLWS